MHHADLVFESRDFFKGCDVDDNDEDGMLMTMPLTKLMITLNMRTLNTRNVILNLNEIVTLSSCTIQ